MDGDLVAREAIVQDAQSWALAHFAGGGLGDKRRARRMVQLAAAMAQEPAVSLPKQNPRWADLMGAYRLLSNPHVLPEAIRGPHRLLVQAACAGRGVVLSVQDSTQLNLSSKSTKIRGLGQIGDGGGRGLVQHTALAVSVQGQVIGVLAQNCHKQAQSPEGETRRQRQARWCESDLWSDTAQAIGPAPQGCRWVQVADRDADIFGFMEDCLGLGQGFVVRARANRKVNDGAGRMWEHLASRAEAGQRELVLRERRDPKGRVVARNAKVKLAVRWAQVVIPPPTNDPRRAGHRPIAVWAVYVQEVGRPPQGVEPVEWMLLTSEAIADAEDAWRIAGWYTRRWVIEEWHRVEKEGCRVEATQLSDAQDVCRLAAIQSVVAVRMLQLRDLAEMGVEPAEESRPSVPPAQEAGAAGTTHAGEDSEGGTPAAKRQALAAADDPAWLRLHVGPMLVWVVSVLAGVDAPTLTPRQFWRTLAQRGGWLGRKGDGRPGWKTLWRGWSDIQRLVEGAQLAARHPAPVLPMRSV